MTKHTPGPWALHHAKGAFSISEDGDAERPGYGFVCATGGASLIDEMNASLIAAAPELLAALKAAVDVGIIPKSSALDGGANKHSRQVHVADQIRAAIARAEREDR